MRCRGVAQLVAHRVWDAGVRGSSPRTPTCCGRRQVVRHQPSKLIFAGSNPVARSRARACSSMAEQSAHNRPVPGSNPGGPIRICALGLLAAFSILPRRLRVPIPIQVMQKTGQNLLW